MLQQRVLVAPLDWGLGHATRCIPIIYELLAVGIEVIIAADGKAKKLLQNEFPELVFIDLRGYNVQYSSNRRWLPIKLMLQMPRVLLRIYKEHQWLKIAIKQYHLTAIISDNRLGLFNKTTTSVYITHQLKIKAGNAFATWLAQKIHYTFINKYSQCWVPDNVSEDNLAGTLSHPKKLPPIPVHYLGPLSRFIKTDVEKKYDCILLLSGPEPQRTIFENILLDELKSFSGKALLVRGLPGETNQCVCENTAVEIKNHLSAVELNQAILQSDVVICRSGYTSVMDLTKLHKKAILVATPGQTEQEYLAQYLQEQNVFLSLSQNKFSLQNALQLCNEFPFKNINLNQELYKERIRIFADELQKTQEV